MIPAEQNGTLVIQNEDICYTLIFVILQKTFWKN